MPVLLAGCLHGPCACSQFVSRSENKFKRMNSNERVRIVTSKDARGRPEGQPVSKALLDRFEGTEVAEQLVSMPASPKAFAVGFPMVVWTG